MTEREIEREILDLVSEDYYGLWEIGWRLATSVGVDPSVDPRLPADVIRSLRRQLLVEVYVKEWVDAAPRPVDPSDPRFDLNHRSAWLEPDHDKPQILIGPRGYDDFNSGR